MSAFAPKTVIVAVADMTWSAMQARVAAGSLPGLSALLVRGARARMVQPDDMRAISAWPTIATGLGVEAHGIVSREEIWAGGLRVSGRQSWQASPYWEWLEANGIPTIGVGWPSIRPGADWAGVQVDDRLAEPHGQTWDEWILPRDVAPTAFREVLREVRVHPTDITAAQLRPFVPDIAAVDQFRDQRLVDIALALARFSTDFAAFSTLMAQVPWRVATLHLGVLEALHARFAEASPPFGGVIDAGWTLIDSAAATLLAGLPANGTLILVSPGRGGDAGVMLAAGPGLPADTELSTFQLWDVAPSLLARHGLSSPDLPGKARLNAPKVTRTVSAPPLANRSVAPAANDLARIAAFGLRPPQPPARVWAARLAEQAERLIVSDPAAARRLAEEALAIAPDMGGAIGIIAASLAGENAFVTFPALADRLAAIQADHPWLPLIRAGYHASRREVALADPLLRQAEREGGPAEWVRAAAAWLMLGRPAEAQRLFERVLERQPDSITALTGIGMTGSAQPDRAEEAFRRVLTLDPGNRRATLGLRRLSLQNRGTPARR